MSRRQAREAGMHKPQALPLKPRRAPRSRRRAYAALKACLLQQTEKTVKAGEAILRILLPVFEGLKEPDGDAAWRLTKGAEHMYVLSQGAIKLVEAWQTYEKTLQ